MASPPELEAQQKVADAIILERAARVLTRRGCGFSKAYYTLTRLALELRREADRDGD
jgi:hypothetical protein